MKKLISTCLVALTLAATMAFTVYAETPVNEEPIPVVTEETTYEEPAQIPAEAGEPSLLTVFCTQVNRELSNISQCGAGYCNANKDPSVQATVTTTYICPDGTPKIEVAYNVTVYCC